MLCHASGTDQLITFKQQLVIHSRGPGFDQIRLLAAVVVVLHHCSGVTHPDIRQDLLFTYSQGFTHFGILAVAVFFALSGYLVTPRLARTRNLVEFLAHRAVRIFPALALVVVASMLLLGPVFSQLRLFAYFADPGFLRYAKNMLTLTSPSLPGVIHANGGLAVVNGALWTLNVEVLSYLSLALLSIFGALQHRLALCCVFLFVYAFNAVIWFDPTLAAFVPARLAVFVSLFVYFCAGALLYIYADRVAFSPVVAASVFVLAVMALPIGLGVVVLPIALPYLVAFLGMSPISVLSAQGGDISYGIYLFHCPILTATVLLFPQVHSASLVSGLVLGVTVIVARLSWLYVEKPALTRKEEVSTTLNAWVRDTWVGLTPLKDRIPNIGKRKQQ